MKKDAASVAKRLARVIIKKRVPPTTGLQAGLYLAFSIGSAMGMGLDDFVEIVEESAKRYRSEEREDRNG